jgi:crossover junction endodeoxyribonuclease RuvC
MRVLGIDPGLTGALALIETSLDALVIRDMPVARSGTGTRQEIVPVLLAEMIRALDPDVAFLERVNAMPKQGVSSVFTFGQGYGMIRGVLAALLVPVELVTPGHWKRIMRLDKDKSRARAVAMNLFPRDAKMFQRVKDHDRAEAALLAWLGLRMVAGENKTTKPG